MDCSIYIIVWPSYYRSKTVFLNYALKKIIQAYNNEGSTATSHPSTTWLEQAFRNFKPPAIFHLTLMQTKRAKCIKGGDMAHFSFKTGIQNHSPYCASSKQCWFLIFWKVVFAIKWINIITILKFNDLAICHQPI